jgi:hypothetical protein
MFPIAAQCPLCSANLMDEAVYVDGHPSVRVVLRYGGKESVLHLSAIYGSFRFVSEVPVGAGDETELLCEHCGQTLVTDSRCEVCSAALCFLHLTVGGDVLFCSRRGCKYHRAETDDLERSLIELTRRK